MMSAGLNYSQSASSLPVFAGKRRAEALSTQQEPLAGETDAAIQSPHLSSRKSTWNPPSLAMRIYNTSFQWMLGVTLGLYGLAEVPVSSSLQQYQQEGKALYRKHVEPSILIPMTLLQAMGIEIALYMIFFRKRIGVTHELGHSLGFRHLEKQVEGKTKPVEESVKGSSAFYESEGMRLFSCLGGISGHLTVPVSQYFKQTYETYLNARDKKLVHLPGFSQKRKEIQDLARLKLIVNMAGPMLEGLLLGRIGPWTDLGDTLQNRECLQVIAETEKPESQWQAGEYRAFWQAEKKKAYDATVELITSLDKAKVIALVEQCLKEAKAGKTCWSGEALSLRLDALYSS